jgi:uncharacterized protein (DUF1330 family)
MKPGYKLVLALLAGVALGALAVKEVGAQGTPPAYVITEVDVIEPEAYTKDYAPRVQPTFQPFGGRYLIRGGKTIALEGEPPKRVVVIAFDSVEKAQAWRDSAAYKEIKPLRDRLAKVRAFIIEGLPR